ncbi:MAG: serine hydrolase domain-containing protein, partial [Ilumatobacteraceae bacterium]
MTVQTHLTPSVQHLAVTPARRSTAIAAALVAAALLAGAGCGSTSTATTPSTGPSSTTPSSTIPSSTTPSSTIASSTVPSTTAASEQPAPIVDQGALQAELDDLVALGVPGVVVMVRADDQSVVLTAGVSDLDTGTPMSPDATFRIASLTKPFTAGVVMQLVAEDTLGLDDTV